MYRLLDFRTTQDLETNKLMGYLESVYFVVLKKMIFEWNDEISSEILPSFRTEVVEDRGVTLTKVKCPLPMNIQIPFL